MRKKAITVAAATTGVLASVLGQQAHASAAEAAHSAGAARIAAGISAATVPSPLNANTSLTFTVGTTGNLTINVPDAAPLGSANPGTTSPATPIGTVTVTDTRSAVDASWTTTASATDLTTTGGTIPAADITYDPRTVTVNFGSVTPAGSIITLLNTPQPVVSVTGSGNNTVSWNPTLSIAVPAGAVTGVYNGTLTHSVA
jgi:hypothetical protein